MTRKSCSRSVKELAFHPWADLFPLMEGDELDALAADICKNGQRQSIMLCEGMILDGRNRYRACKLLGIQPTTESYTGNDPLGYVISCNLHRRHLSASQRAMIAASIAALAVGSNQYVKRATRDPRMGGEFSPPKAIPTAANLAHQLGVDRKTLNQAKAVHQGCVPTLKQRVERGDLAVSVACGIAKLPDLEQEKIAMMPEKQIKGAAKALKRAARERALAHATAAASARLGSILYSVIYADPPWQFAPYSRETGMDRAADNHYPTMTLEKLKKMVPPAAKNAILFMWTTVPMCRQSMELMEAWGFDYVSQFVWAKDKIGTGYWNRNQHEILLIGTRGDMPAPAPGEQHSSLITAPVGKHSTKPAAFAEMIEAMFPNAQRLEMFARQSRPRWDSWGNECDDNQTENEAEDFSESEETSLAND